MRHPGNCLVLAAVFYAVTMVSSAHVHAYPQYIAKGYTTCASCHYSPDGGGMLNAYGAATVEALFPSLVDAGVSDLAESLSKNFVTGYDDEEAAAFQWDMGLDARMLFLSTPTEVGADSQWMPIPMLTELQGVVAYGDWMVHGTIAARQAGARISEGDNAKSGLAPFSRQHWVMYRMSEGLTLRAGRMTLPYGIRNPDHSAYVRRDLGFDKYDQSHGVQADWLSEDWVVSGMLVAGDLTAHGPIASERGAVVSATALFAGRGAIGLSAMAVIGEQTDRTLFGAHLRATPGGGVYAMGECDVEVTKTKDGAKSQTVLPSFFRVGVMPWEWFDAYVEIQTRVVSGVGDLSRISYGSGFHWQVLP
ncbi:MAG: hypothetical protein VX834_02345 [Myxococcota bacterium]|nr:hypothetical protein [Myxococcota bacterium]